MGAALPLEPLPYGRGSAPGAVSLRARLCLRLVFPLLTLPGQSPIFGVMVRASRLRTGYERHKVSRVRGVGQWRVRCAALWAGMVLLGGCDPQDWQLGLERWTATQPYDPALPPTTDRLLAAYPDLASRQFQVLADFEEPEQATLFHKESAGRSDPLVLSTERARPDTGVGALKMALISSAEQVVAADTPDSRWSLYRDWSGYHLLLLSVFSPRDLGGFTFSVRSGTDQMLRYRHPRIFLRPGWNLIRVDLADVAEDVNLADVRELRFWCEPLDTPIELYLDDIILVNNEKLLFGGPQLDRGDLYVKAMGRRLVVGAEERFELVFHRGRIQQWFDLAHDPSRLRNLVGRGTLGPSPVVIPGGVEPIVRLDDMGQWSGLGITAESYQTLAEALPLRVVIQGEWRFGSPDQGFAEDSPHHRWSYSIYPDGRVYIACTGTARSPTFTPPALGVVFSCDRDLGFVRQIVEHVPSTAGGQPIACPYTLFARPERGMADLLVVPAQPLATQTARTPDDLRLSVQWRLPAEGDWFNFAAMCRVWPADIDSPDQAGPIALDYSRPLPIHLDVGRLLRTDEGDFNNDGFSESRGYYVLQLDGHRARLRIDGRSQLRFSPVFKLLDVASREVWVYRDGRQVREISRDPQGDVLFMIDGVISDEVLVEVMTGPREAPASGMP